jgi:hypothetical protein
MFAQVAPVLTNSIVLTPIQIRLSVLMPNRIQNLPQVLAKKFLLLFTAVPVYIVSYVSHLHKSHHFHHFKQNIEISGK